MMQQNVTAQPSPNNASQKIMTQSDAKKTKKMRQKTYDSKSSATCVPSTSVHTHVPCILKYYKRCKTLMLKFCLLLLLAFCCCCLTTLLYSTRSTTTSFSTTLLLHSIALYCITFSLLIKEVSLKRAYSE